MAIGAKVDRQRTSNPAAETLFGVVGTLLAIPRPRELRNAKGFGGTDKNASIVAGTSFANFSITGIAVTNGQVQRRCDEHRANRDRGRLYAEQELSRRISFVGVGG